MGYQTASTDDVESALPEEAGGLWFLKDALDTDHLGFTVLELAPGEAGKEHSHEDQEEVYYVAVGRVTVELGGESVSLGPGEAVRVDPEQSRRIVNDGEERSRLVLVGAPRDAD